MSTEYRRFLESKTIIAPAVGVTLNARQFPAAMFDFQKDLTAWALRKGRAAIFADTGLGKSVMQLAWAEQAAERVLILAPLAVTKQTVIEGQKWKVDVKYARTQSESAPRGITITNYEMVDRFDPDSFGAVVLDESSILKNFEGKTRKKLIETFERTPMRLCCTATPAPNDIAEIANHAEFLGLMTRAEMLASFFVHDDNGWRLKGHAREPFYRWLASWGMTVKKPSDLGYDDGPFQLPMLSIAARFVECDYRPEGQLFATTLKGVGERAAIRKATLHERVSKAVELINEEPDESWLVWCGLNDESMALAKALPGAVEVKGSDSQEHKEKSLLGFASGEIKILVSKPRIAGFGMNFQNCARMIFVGLNDSYELYYQSIRRCWRFGQTRHVVAYVVLSEGEHAILDNVLRKEREAQQSSVALLNHVTEYERAEIGKTRSKANYSLDKPMVLPRWMEAR